MLAVQLKKTYYATKITEIEKELTNHNHDKYITTLEFNALAASAFNGRLALANLITKTDFDPKLSSLHRNVTANKTKHLLVENELKKLKTFDSSCFIGKSYFEEDGTQNYLAFQSMYRYFKVVADVRNGRYIYYWQSKGLSNERINSITTSNYSVTLFLDYYGTETRVEFSVSCLKQDKVTFNHEKIVNVYIVNEISKNINISNYPTLKNRLFGAVSLNKNADIDWYGYSGYGIGFDRHGSFSLPCTGLGSNVIIIL